MSDKTPDKRQPIIEGVKRNTDVKRDIILWSEEKKNISLEQYDALSPREQEKFNKMRDLHGRIVIGDGTGTREISVSAWFSTEANQAPRLIVMGDLKSGQGFMGSIKAMVKYNGQPANGRYGLRLIGDVDIKSESGKERFTISGAVNEAFPDRELLLDAGRVFGFPDAMVAQLDQKLRENDAQKAHNAQKARQFVASQPRPQVAAMQP